MKVADEHSCGLGSDRSSVVSEWEAYVRNVLGPNGTSTRSALRVQIVSVQPVGGASHLRRAAFLPRAIFASACA
jgi:hypothetical protein